MTDDPNDYVWIAPCRKSGQPCVGGTRLPVSIVAEYIWGGDPVDHVAREYSITPVQALVACWYTGKFGSRTWKKRWSTWADIAHPFLWDRERQAQCPSPPSTEREGER